MLGLFGMGERAGLALYSIIFFEYVYIYIICIYIHMTLYVPEKDMVIHSRKIHGHILPKKCKKEVDRVRFSDIIGITQWSQGSRIGA